MSALFQTPKPQGSLPPLPKLDDPDVRRRRQEERMALRRDRAPGSTILTGVLAKGGETGPGPALPDAAPQEAPPVFGLKGRVGRGRANQFADVKAAKGALARAGYYPAVLAREPDGRVDPQMRSAILGFQSDKGLRIDGWMGPGGQTERELERTIRPKVLAHKAKETPAKEAAPVRPDGEVRKSDPPAGEGLRISIPEGGVPRSDPEGAGRFHSKRGDRLHEGVDITVRPGQMVPAPIDGVVIKTGIVYREDNMGLHSTHIEGTGKWTGYTVKMFYMNNDSLKEGAPVKRGAPLGPAQDVSLRRNKVKMTPHIHYEVYKDGKLIDPTKMLIGKK